MRVGRVKCAVPDEEFAAMLVPLPDSLFHIGLGGKLSADGCVHQSELARFEAPSAIKARTVAREFRSARVPQLKPDAPISEIGQLSAEVQVAGTMMAQLMADEPRQLSHISLEQDRINSA